MRSRLGELYQCAEQGCGFEVLVVHDSSRTQQKGPCPICCCGSLMHAVA
jgi:predicted RNA-binding Zn ribbon-like protein